MLSLPCTAYDRILLCLFLVFLTLFWAFLTFQIHPSHLPETGPAKIAELGCGGGRNIRALLRKYPAATITALDYSEISVEKAKRVNREGLQAGRCQILQG